MAEYSHTLTNPGAESGDLTGWSTDAGSPSVSASIKNSGSYSFYSGGASATLSQEIDLESDGVPTADIDLGGLSFRANWYSYVGSTTSITGITIRFKDSDKVLISDSSSDLLNFKYCDWVEREITKEIPAETRYVDIILNFTDGGYIDDITTKTLTTPQVEIIKEDFSGYPVSTTPADWSEVFGAVTPTITIDADGQLVMSTDGQFGEVKAYTWDDLGLLADVDFAVKWKADLSPASGISFRVMVRFMGNSSNNAFCSLDVTGNDVKIIANDGSGSSDTETSVYSITMATDTWFWSRLHISGTTVKVKVWNDSVDEPKIWAIQSDISGMPTESGKIVLWPKGLSAYDVTVSNLTVYANAGNIGNLRANLPIIVTNFLPIVRSWIDVTIPVLTIDSCTGSLFSAVLPGLQIENSYTGSVIDVLLPTISIESSIAVGANVDAILPVLRINSYTNSTIIDAKLPQLTIDSYINLNRTAVIDSKLPVLSLESHTGSLINLNLPNLTIEAIGGFAVISSLDAKLPTLTIKSTIYNNFITVDAKIPFLTLETSASAVHWSTLNSMLPALEIKSISSPVIFGVVNCMLPNIEIESTASNNYVFIDTKIPCLSLKSVASIVDHLEDNTIIVDEKFYDLDGNIIYDGLVYDIDGNIVSNRDGGIVYDINGDIVYDGNGNILYNRDGLLRNKRWWLV